MTELDSLLWTDRCLKKCKDKGIGFYFCKSYRGDYVSWYFVTNNLTMLTYPLEFP